MLRPRVIASILLTAILLAGTPALGLWTHKTRFTRSPDLEDMPRIAVAGCRVHVVWINFSDNSLYFNRSTDGGSTWMDRPELLAQGGHGPILQLETAATEELLHIVWQEGANDDARIIHASILSDGTFLSEPRIISRRTRSSEQPTLAIDGEYTYVAWLQTRHGRDTKPAKILFARSSDGGLHWSNARKVGRRSAGIAKPFLLSSEERLHLLWGHRNYIDGAWDLGISHRASLNHGRSWSPRSLVVDGGWRLSSAAADGVTIHLVWEDASYKLSFIKYQRSSDEGRTWSAPRTLSQGSHASITADHGELEQVSIEDWDGTGLLLHRRSEDGGLTWSSTRKMTRNARFPALAATAPADGACGSATHLTYGRNWWKNGRAFQEVFYRRHPRRTGW